MQVMDNVSWAFHCAHTTAQTYGFLDHCTVVFYFYRTGCAGLLACMMTVCNMLVHGCVGEVICHDSLQPKAFTDGWKVNQALPLTGIPSIRRMKEEEYRNPLPENIGRFKEAVRIINLLDK